MAVSVFEWLYAMMSIVFVVWLGWHNTRVYKRNKLRYPVPCRNYRLLDTEVPSFVMEAAKKAGCQLVIRQKDDQTVIRVLVPGYIRSLEVAGQKLRSFEVELELLRPVGMPDRFYRVD
jgi:hypothetical protein